MLIPQAIVQSGVVPGYEFGYDQITGNVTVTSSTESAGTTIIACAPHSFDGEPVFAQFFTQLQPSSGSQVTCSLFEDATQITRLCEYIPGTISSTQHPYTTSYRFTPTAGTHTYTVTAYRGSSNGSIIAGSGGTGGEPPTFIRFIKV